MASLVHKRIYVFIALVLTLGIFTPTLVKVGHALNGHSQEKHCIAQGTEHVHGSDIGCEFHDFTVSNRILFITAFEFVLVDLPPVRHTSTNYAFIYHPLSVDFQALRGPPTVV